MKQNQEEMEQMKKSWQERLQETEAAYKVCLSITHKWQYSDDYEWMLHFLWQAKEEEEKKEKEMRKTTPHFWNLNEDPQLSNMIVHFIKPGRLIMVSN